MLKKVFLYVIILSIIFSACSCERRNDENPEPEKTVITLAAYRDETDTLKRIAMNFSEKNDNIYIRIMELSKDSDENNRLLVSLLSGNEIETDIFIAEDVYIKDYISSGYVKCCDEFLTLPNEYSEQIRDIVYEEGRLYAVPIELDTGVMLYRSDWTDGRQSYIDIANDKTAKLSVCKMGQSDTLSVLGECIEVTGGIDKGLELFRYFCNSTGNGDADRFAEFKNGETKCVRVWTSESEVIKNSFGKISGRIKARILKEESFCYGETKLYCAAVNSNSPEEKQTAVAEFLKYLASDDVSLELVKGRGTLPIKKKFYGEVAVKDYNEYIGEFESCLDNIRFRTIRKDYAVVAEKAYKSVMAYIKGECTKAEAIEVLKLLYQKSS